MARDFDGVDDIITLGTGNQHINLSALTICAWADLDGFGEGDFGRILETRTAAAQRDIFYVNDAIPVTTFTIEISKTSNAISTAANGTISTGKWFLCGSYMDADGGPRLYVGSPSSPVAETSYGARGDGSGSRLTNATVSYLGNRPAGDRTFNGRLSCVQIFNRVLSIAEMNQVMKYPGSITRGLVFFMPLWGGSPEPDYSGNGNHGTVTGATVSTDNPPINGVFRVPRPELIHVF